jgi:hypothetical protein
MNGHPLHASRTWNATLENAPNPKTLVPWQGSR